MTPALLALSRAYLALPGAPVRDMIAFEMSCPPVDGHPRFRDYAGLLWCPDTEADRPAPWVLDLTDAATGGVMLERFAPVAEPIIDCDSRTGYALRVFGRRFDPESGRATLAEAVARAAVALGRAG